MHFVAFFVLTGTMLIEGGVLISEVALFVCTILYLKA